MMVVPTKAHFKMGRNMGQMENSIGKMVAVMLESGKIIKLKVWASISGLMGELTRAYGSKIKCMDRDNTPGQMEDDIRATTLMISSRAKEYLYGRMVEFMKEIGSKENSMAEVPLHSPLGKK